MGKEFIPYEQALALKKLGFNQSCLSYYSDSFHGGFQHKISKVYSQTEYSNQICSTPLYQQAFRWFREKHKLSVCIESHYTDEWFYFYKIEGEARNYGENKDYDTYEKTELASIKKLIEIVQANEKLIKK